MKTFKTIIISYDRAVFWDLTLNHFKLEDLVPNHLSIEIRRMLFFCKARGPYYRIQNKGSNANFCKSFFAFSSPGGSAADSV